MGNRKLEKEKREAQQEMSGNKLKKLKIMLDHRLFEEGGWFNRQSIGLFRLNVVMPMQM
jgi:hypothetical protein